jgi:hypothetical protein
MAKLSAIKGDNQQGIEHATQAKSIFEKQFGQEHPHFKNSQGIIDALTERLMDAEKGTGSV